MGKNNNKLSRYIPLIVAISVLVGFALSVYVFPVRSTINIPFASKMAVKSDKYYSDKFNQVKSLIQNSYVDSIANDKIDEIAIVSLLDSLDPHSVYISKEDLILANEQITGNFEGIGIQFRLEKDSVYVVDVIKGGPAEKAIRTDLDNPEEVKKAINTGLRAGDRIISVDDSIVSGVNKKNKDIMSLIRGPKGTKVNLGVKRKTIDSLIYFEITRGVIPNRSVEVSYMVNDTVGFIKITSFTLSTSDEFRNALQSLKSKGMKNLILDLRGNGGGLLQAAIDVCSELLKPQTLVVYTEGYNHPRRDIYTNKKGLFNDGKVVVLVDETSASASEIVAGAIQDYDRGTIVGRRTFGKGLVQEQIPLLDSSAIRLTVSRYYTPSGRCIQRSYESGKNEYYHDFLDRLTSGELMNADSIQVKDTTKKYYTSLGRVVYGGGGIVPDVFVPLKDLNENEYYYNLLDKSILFDFAFDYTDNNREELLQKYPSISDYIENFKVTWGMYDKIINMADRAEIRFSQYQFNKAKPDIEILVKAYIGRNLFDSKGFYYFYNKMDNDVKEALDSFNYLDNHSNNSNNSNNSNPN